MELKVIVNPIDRAGPGGRLLSNLFHGCGYNFYRCESQLQVDDLLIREKLMELLGESRAHLRSLEAAFRREHGLSSPDEPFPSPRAVALAQALDRAQCDIQAMEKAIRTAAMPETCSIHHRNRGLGGTLQRLVALDGQVLLAVLTLRDAIARLNDATAAAVMAGDLVYASDFSALWSRRDALLTGESGVESMDDPLAWEPAETTL